MYLYLALFVMLISGTLLSGNAVMAVDVNPATSTKTIWIDPFTITESTYEVASTVSEEECQQKIKALDKARCQPGNQGNGAKSDPDVIKRCQMLRPSEGLSCECKVKIIFPQFASQEYDQAILNKINLELKDRAEKFKNKYAGSTTNCTPSNMKTIYNLTYHLEFDGKYGGAYKLYQNGKILTVQYNSYFTWNSTPVAFNTFLNFDLSNGKLLTFEDIIEKKLLTEVYDAVWLTITKNPKSNFYNDQVNTFTEAKAKHKLLYRISNFYLGADALIVYFNPYEIGPRDFGDFVIQLSKKYVIRKYR